MGKTSNQPRASQDLERLSQQSMGSAADTLASEVHMLSNELEKAKRLRDKKCLSAAESEELDELLQRLTTLKRNMGWLYNRIKLQVDMTHQQISRLTR